MGNSDDKIEEIETIQETKHMIWAALIFKKSYPLIRPFMRVLGMNVENIDETLERTDVEGMWQDYKELAKLSDKFNEVFGDYGWIMYFNMNAELAKEALEVAEEDSIEAAEELLVTYYDSTEVKRQIDGLRSVEAFEPRINLAYKAWQDYEEERYHACIPVILSLMDGLVIHTSVEELGFIRGFFYQTANFTAWDSVAAHENGLERLADQDLFLKSRNSTTIDQIDIPYRHGILHGIDLGYDNKMVAAKSWAALFAVGEWARKAERGELEEPSDSEDDDQSLIETIIESVKDHEKNEKRKKIMQEWKPRGTKVGEEISSEGDPDEYDKGTPERALVATLYYWKIQNWGYLAQSFIQKDDEVNEVSDVIDEFEDIELCSYRLVEITDFAPALSEISVELLVDRGEGNEWEEKTVLMTYLRDNGKSGVPEVDDGGWTVSNREVFLDRWRG